MERKPSKTLQAIKLVPCRKGCLVQSHHAGMIRLYGAGNRTTAPVVDGDVSSASSTRLLDVSYRLQCVIKHYTRSMSTIIFDFDKISREGLEPSLPDWKSGTLAFELADQKI